MIYQTALHIAAKDNNIKIVKLLLEKKNVDTTIKNLILSSIYEVYFIYFMVFL